MKNVWQLQEAKNQLSTVVENALTKGVQTITRHGELRVAEVVAHVTKSEAGTLQYVKKKTQDPKALPKAGIVPWFRIGALVVGIHSPMKFKAPKAMADLPETGDFQAASFAWAEVREDWREFIEAFPQVLNDRLIFRHPFVGLLGPAQLMIFLNQHLGNHVRQIARIRKTLNV